MQNGGTVDDLTALRRTRKRHLLVLDSLSRAKTPAPQTQRDYSEELAAIDRAIDRLLIDDLTVRHADSTGSR